MSWSYPDAQEWARDQSLANVPRLARLESFAFQRHPDMLGSTGRCNTGLLKRA